MMVGLHEARLPLVGSSALSRAGPVLRWGSPGAGARGREPSGGSGLTGEAKEAKGGKTAECRAELH